MVDDGRCFECGGEGIVGDHNPCPICTAPAIFAAIGDVEEIRKAVAVLQDQLDAVYAERNLLAQLVARLATEHISRQEDPEWGTDPEFDAWKGTDPDEPDWPVIYIETPAGQISYHIPEDEMIVDLLDHPHFRGIWDGKWDGHTKEDVRRRIRHLLGIHAWEPLTVAGEVMQQCAICGKGPIPIVKAKKKVEDDGR